MLGKQGRQDLEQVWRWYCSWTGTRGGSSSSLPAGGAVGLDNPLKGGKKDEEEEQEEEGLC